jgi:hypothetical protein
VTNYCARHFPDPDLSPPPCCHSTRFHPVVWRTSQQRTVRHTAIISLKGATAPHGINNLTE